MHIEPDDTTDQNGDGSVDEDQTAEGQSVETGDTPDSESGDDSAAATPTPSTPVASGDVGDRRHASARARRRNRGR